MNDDKRRYKIDPFADVRMGKSLFEMSTLDWVVETKDKSDMTKEEVISAMEKIMGESRR